MLRLTAYQTGCPGLAPENGACKIPIVLTLEDLCAAMTASGRSLTPRAARDWWTKGLLPRPHRRGLGRGVGTETYWPDPRVIAHAEAAYDFLARHSRTYSAGLYLWLSGFPVDLRLVRGAYQRIIGRHFRSVRGRSADDLEGAVSALAARAARHLTKSQAVPRHVLHAIADLTLPYLDIFFGSTEEFEGTGLSELWALVEPYVGHAKDQAPFPLSDDALETAAFYLSQMASLPAQREAICSATDYEMIRARRLVHLVFGHLQHIAKSVESSRDAKEFCRPLLIAFGRPAIPILIMVLRQDAFRRRAIPYLLDLVIKARRQIRQGWAPSIANHVE